MRTRVTYHGFLKLFAPSASVFNFNSFAVLCLFTNSNIFMTLEKTMPRPTTKNPSR